MAEKREQMLESGFRIFAERSIESVTMQDVALDCKVGLATMYRYFGTKLDFVITIGALQWEAYFREVEEEYHRRGGDMMTAAEELDFYLGAYVILYREHRDILRFNQNFNSYIIHENASKEQLARLLIYWTDAASTRIPAC